MWSPRQLADLAGTSRRTVRHYHEIGLLPEPARQSNGYQRYGVDHLIRLLRIRRLAGLGFTLPQIAAIGEADRPPAQMLRALTTELTHSIEQMQQARRELAAMLELAAPADLPVELTQRISDIPAADRALVIVLTRLFKPASLDAYLDLMEPYRNHVAAVALEHLPADATASARAAVGSALADHMNQLCADHPQQFDLIDNDLFIGVTPRRRIVHQAVHELYNVAQVDAMARSVQLRGRPAPRLLASH